MKKVLEELLYFVNEHWEILTPILYEVLGRIIPTKNNISIIDNVVKIIRFIIPNKRKPLPTDNPVQADPDFNRVIVDRKKHIIPIIIFFMLGAHVAFGQLNGTFKTLRFIPAQDTTNLTSINVYPAGTITKLSNDSLYYRAPNGYWKTFGSGGGGSGGLSTADNGLTVNPAGNVQLGGTLLAGSQIHLAGNTFAFDGNGVFDIGVASGVNIGDFTVSPTTISLTAENAASQTSLFVTPEELAINSTDVVSIASSVFGVDAVGSIVQTANGGDFNINAPNSSLIASSSDIQVLSTGNILLDGAAGSLEGYGGSIYFESTNDFEMLSGANLILDATNNITSGAGGNASFYSINQNTTAYFGVGGASTFGSAGITATDVAGVGNTDFFGDTFTLNGDAGAAGEFFAADGTWAVPAGGGASPGGANTNVQYNDGGAFGGDADFTFDESSTVLALIQPAGNNQMRLSATNLTRYVSGAPTMFLDNDQLSTQAGTGQVFRIQPSGSLSLVPDNGTTLIGTTSAIGATLQATSTNADTNFTIRAGGAGFIILDTLPTTCTGAPSNSLANVAGTLTICP